MGKARDYLILQDATDFFLSPSNDVEAAINHGIITNLIKSIDRKVNILFKTNSVLLNEFKNELLTKKRLDKSEVLEFIARAKISN